jgi:sialate O-acetylesterase
LSKPKGSVKIPNLRGGYIHPKNKLDVGRRLSRWALNKTYGFADIVPSGPFYSFSEKRGASIIIVFDYPGSGLMVGQKTLMEPVVPSSAPLGGFEICGEDRQWKIASAKIVREDAVEVSHESIQKPIAVRYAWQSNPTNANLNNKEGLPASLFTTENPVKGMRQISGVRLPREGNRCWN